MWIEGHNLSSRFIEFAIEFFYINPYIPLACAIFGLIVGVLAWKKIRKAYLLIVLIYVIVTLIYFLIRYQLLFGIVWTLIGIVMLWIIVLAIGSISFFVGTLLGRVIGKLAHHVTR